MPHPTIMDILKQLPRTNCRQCHQPTCMAFAAKILQGEAGLSDCPHVDHMEMDANIRDEDKNSPNAEDYADQTIEKLKNRMSAVDFTSIAERLDVTLHGKRVAVRCLGKIFEIDENGDLHSECHINHWVHLPILSYISKSHGLNVKDEWVTFSELENSGDWVRFFDHRCEKGMQTLVDRNPALFFDIIDLFAAERAIARSNEAFSSADYASVLYPLPKVPMLISYWRADSEFDAKLLLFFDRTAEANLGAESIYLLVMGMIEMLKRIISRHGV